MVSIQALGARARAHAASALLVGGVALLAAWRVALVLSGPDADSDAYGHHMIARQILADPSDLGVHWVWLPLFHYLQVPLVAAGATMNTIRFINVGLWAWVPLVLFLRVRRGAGGGAGAAPLDPLRDWTALFAALVCALSPIGMQMGTTAQPEPLFCLCVLGFIVFMDRRAYWSAALLLAAATMLRYEGWAILPVVAALNLAALVPTRLRVRLALPLHVGWRKWLPVAVPVLLIFGWAFARRPYDGAWFGFLTQTREFANGAMGTKSSLDGGFARLAEDLIYYAARVPWRAMGPAVLLVPIGLVRTARTQGPLFFLSYLACLAFLTLTWVMRSSLGLDRHFVVMLPCYATLAANGLAQIVELARDRSRNLRIASYVVATAGGAAALAMTWIALASWMHEWRGALETSWPDRIAVGAYLRTVPPRDVVFCDEATIELLSGMGRERFDRHWVDDPAELARVKEAADRDGAAYVATWMRKLKGLRGVGELVYRPPGETSADEGIGVLKVTR